MGSTSMDVNIPSKPTLRGVSHQFAAMVAFGAGVVLVAMAPSARASWGAAVFALSLTWLLAVSAVYHRPTWPPRTRQWLRRLDHASIFVLIAGTYTPVCLLGLPPAAGRELLALAWLGAALGIAQSLFWIKAPKALLAALCVALGWIMVPYLGDFGPALTNSFTVLIGAGGLAYTAGAVIYAVRRPNPVPGVFGYHEVFHALVVLASGCHFAAVILLVRGGTAP